MDYFDDLNPYLVRQENETPPTQTPGTPPVNPGAIGQVYLGNIIKLNTGKLVLFILLLAAVINGAIKVM